MALDPAEMTPGLSNYKPDKILKYKSAGDMELKAHIFEAGKTGQTGGQPVFVFFHPGGWNMGEPAWGYDVCHRYASFGMVAISFQYRLSAVGGYTPVDAAFDVRSAIRWTRQNADELGIDPKRLVAGGISAGAHLAACAAILQGPDDPGDNTDISCVPEALVLQSAVLNPGPSIHFVELLQGRYKPEDYSPFHHIRPGLPPMCLLHGTADEIVPYSSVSEFTARTREEGNECILHTFEGTDHFFMNSSDQRKAMELIDEYIAGLGYIKRNV